MIKSELCYNPYLLLTYVKFNGSKPKRNSQVEEHVNERLQDWIKELPEIFYNEMNGYGFELEFSGPESDFRELVQAFKYAGVGDDKVTFSHISKMEDREQKYSELQSLFSWLKAENNQQFNFEAFYQDYPELFENNYQVIIINGNNNQKIESGYFPVDSVFINNIKELEGSDLSYSILTDATTFISGKTLGLHLGFPRETVPGLPVIEHAEFGKEVNTYQLSSGEEAHNLLKSSSSSETELVRKSVEMLTNTIAEIRTYGEGFIIVDQSPTSVDIAAIKNTNTKIVLRTPELHDREAVGRSMGLTENQINEIAKLPGGVAIVYQNNWIAPVLTRINKAEVSEEKYIYRNPMIIKPLHIARTEIIKALMQPWIPAERIRGKELEEDLQVLEVVRSDRKKIADYLDDYVFLGGKEIWNVNDIPILQSLLKAILNLPQNVFEDIVISGDADWLCNNVHHYWCC